MLSMPTPVAKACELPLVMFSMELYGGNVCSVFIMESPDALGSRDSSFVVRVAFNFDSLSSLFSSLSAI